MNTPGKITITRMPDGRYRAKARMRLQDRTRTDPETGAYLTGRRVDLTAVISTPGDAEAAITAKAEARIAEARRADATKVSTAKADALVSVADAAAKVFDTLDEELAPNSLYLYRRHAIAYLRDSALGAMPVVTIKAGDVRDYLDNLAATVGIPTARTGRAVVRRVLRWAVESGLRDDDPSVGARILSPRQVRSGHRQTTGALDHHRALTDAERLELAWAVARDERAKDLDLRDLVLTGLAIGGRIGEMCAIRWCDIELTESGARVTLSGTVTRINGKGLTRDISKTAASVRDLPASRRIAALLRRRAKCAGVTLDDTASDTRPVFPNPGRWKAGEGWRDPSNTQKALRRIFDLAGFDWVSFHTLRRSVVTRLADALPVRVAADFAGHSSVRTTLDHYVGRSGISDRVADYL